jgi:hypothetical protein
MPIEFHFQEGFSGQTFEIIASGSICATVTARTRYQINLAHIETIELNESDEVVIRERAGQIETSVQIHHNKPFVVLNLVNGKLQVEETSQSPGYV